MTVGPARFVRRVVAAGGRARYARELTAVLIAKACALLLIWHVWFADGANGARHVDVAARIVPNTAPALPATPASERHAGP